jgi:hypothetical protein
VAEEGSAVDFRMELNNESKLHPRWIEAGAAVQAELDRQVFDEAAGLAEAELSQLTLIELARDSVGAFIQITMCGHDLGGHDLGGHKVRGELTGGLTGVNRDWLIIDDCQLVNLSTVVALRGLRRCVGPNNQSTRQSTVQAWLRDRIGLKIAVHYCAARHSYSAVEVGVLCQVGGNYISIHHGSAAELVPLESLSRLVIH